MHELIIIGLGPAGITASIYAARKKIDFIVMGKTLGGQTALSSSIENYTGYQFITGAELVEKFEEHMKKFDIKVCEDEEIKLVKKDNDIIKVETNKKSYSAKSVIISSGKISRKLNIPGEGKLLGKGVSYCATCDGPLFADMDVAVIGGGNSALDAVLQMMKIAKKVYLINKNKELAADPVMVEKAKENDKVVIYNNAHIKEINGDDFVNNIKVKFEEGEKNLPVEGVFIEIGSVPASSFVEEVEKNEKGEIHVNCKCETNIPGIYAAGDVTDIIAKQIITACGEGAKAAIGAFEYLGKVR